MLKFEGKFRKGQTIKAFDFEGRDDCYLIGLITDDNNMEHGFKSYKVIIIEHLMGDLEISHEDNDNIAWIPMELGFMDYDNRVSLA